MLSAFLLIVLSSSCTNAELKNFKSSPLELTDSESHWLKDHPVIRMGIDPGYDPYSFIDNDGTVRGVSIDFLEQISKQSGVRFELRSDLPRKSLIEAVQTDQIDAIATVSLLPEHTKFLAFTDHYLPTPLVIITQEDSPQLEFLTDLEDMQIAIVKGSTSSKKLLATFPEIRPYYVLSAIEGLKAVSLGLADGYVGILGVNELIAQQNGISGLKINAAFDMKDNAQAIGVRKDWAPLASILNKSLKSISEDQQQKFFDRWLPLQIGNIPTLQSQNWIRKLFPFLLILLVLTVISYFLVLNWNRQLQKKLDAKLSQLSKKNNKIEQLNSLLNAMIEASTDAIFVKDNDGIYQLANKAFSYLLDKPIDKIIGSSDAELFPKDVAERIREDEQQITRNGKPKTYEESILRADGEHIPFLSTKGPITVNGELCGIFCIARDISDIKLAIDLLENALFDLEQKVNDRTTELNKSNIKLQHLNQELAHVNKELETFTYSVSHDLKAPLRGIDGYSRLLLDDHSDQLNEEGKLFLNNLRESADNMSHLIDDLLAYSRLERRSLQSQSVLLSALFDRVYTEFKEALEKVNLEVNIAPIELKTDPLALTLILRNLLGNAIKFSRNTPHPEISITAIQSEQQILVTVQDNGIGFDMQFHDRIFDIFQRLQRAEDFPGTGIGLAISLKAAHRLGGSLRAESKPGKGATFYLEFPL